MLKMGSILSFDNCTQEGQRALCSLSVMWYKNAKLELMLCEVDSGKYSISSIVCYVSGQIVNLFCSFAKCCWLLEVSHHL